MNQKEGVPFFDASDFLNSKDIAEHWHRVGFACTPLQSAYLVWHNRTKTLAEKHGAWREIMENLPDCPVAEGHRKSNMGIADALAGSLHSFLQAFISLQENLIKRFYQKGDHAVYRYCVLYEGDEDWSRDGWLYDSAEDCFEDVRADEDMLSSVLCVQITKRWIGDNRAITLCAKADQTVLQLDADGLSEAEANILQAFEWMWFDFPTPFKRGDLVVSPFSPFGYTLFGEEPFVLTNLRSWGGEQLRQNGYPDEDGRYARADRQLQRHRECADETDMTAHGYFQNEDGSIYHECMHHYLDLEYYRGELQGKRRILRAFSSFERGEIDGELLSVAYYVLLQEEALRRERARLSCFTEEGLRLAGLK